MSGTSKIWRGDSAKMKELTFRLEYRTNQKYFKCPHCLKRVKLNVRINIHAKVRCPKCSMIFIAWKELDLDGTFYNNYSQKVPTVAYEEVELQGDGTYITAREKDINERIASLESEVNDLRKRLFKLEGRLVRI